MGKISGLFYGFLKGLKKSFSGKQYLRALNTCDVCGKDSFMYRCLKCEVDDLYRGFNKGNMS